MINTEQKVSFSSGFSMELGNITPCGLLSTNTESKIDLIQMAYYPTDSCAISPSAFLLVKNHSVNNYDTTSQNNLEKENKDVKVTLDVD